MRQYLDLCTCLMWCAVDCAGYEASPFVKLAREVLPTPVQSACLTLGQQGCLPGCCRVAKLHLAARLCCCSPVCYMPLVPSRACAYMPSAMCLEEEAEETSRGGSAVVMRLRPAQVLTELELPHVYHSVARNSPKRITMREKWDTFQARCTARHACASSARQRVSPFRDGLQMLGVYAVDARCACTHRDKGTHGVQSSGCCAVTPCLKPVPAAPTAVWRSSARQLPCLYATGGVRGGPGAVHGGQ